MRAGSKPNTLVACYSIDGELIKTYKSAKKAALSLHLFKRTIDKSIRENKLVHNMMWKRFNIDEVPNHIEPFKKITTTSSPKPVGLIDDNNNVIEAYSSIKEAAIKNNVDPHTIRDMLYNKTKTAKGKKYRFLNIKEANKFGIHIDRYFEKVKVRQYSLDGQLIKIHDSYVQAAKSIDVTPSSIALCVKGEINTVKGYYWIKDDEEANNNLTKLMNRKKYYYSDIIQFDLKGNKINRFKSSKEASEITGIKSKIINQAIRRNKPTNGYIFKGEK